MKNNYFSLDGYRKLISPIYRLILWLIGVSILSISKNYAESYIYVTFYALYWIIYAVFRKNIGYNPKIRLINDYFLIFATLYGKSVDNFINTIFLLLPIINTPNHSSNKRSYTLLYALAIAIIFVCSDFAFPWKYMGGLAAIYVISMFEYVRFRMSRLDNLLLTRLDEFEVREYDFGNLHRIYPFLIETVNASEFASIIKIEKIYCFFLKDGKLHLVNGSELVWKYKCELKESDVLIDGGLIENQQLLINDRNYENVMLLPIKLENKTYVFAIISKKVVSIWSLFYEDVIINDLKPAFKKIARVIQLEDVMRKRRQKQLKKIKDKIVYVNNTTLAMHFVRNKLSPLKNYVELNEIIDTVSEDVKPQLLQVLQEELIKSKRSFDEIKKKTDQILDKEKNPFSVTELYTYSLSKLFVTTRKAWLEHFDISTILLGWDFEKLPKDGYKLNDEGLDILLTDIINNIVKYKFKFAQLSFTENQEQYLIEFRNDTRLSAGAELEVINIVKDFNSDRKFEIYKRKSHGMSIIKNFLLEMNIKHKVEYEAGYFITQLIFEKQK